MDLLELEPEENEADFLQQDLLSNTALPANTALVDDAQDLLDQVFNDSEPACSAPSFGDELLFSDNAIRGASTPANKKIDDAAALNERDEGFDLFEDVHSLDNIESFGEGPGNRTSNDDSATSGGDVFGEVLLFRCVDDWIYLCGSFLASYDP